MLKLEVSSYLISPYIAIKELLLINESSKNLMNLELPLTCNFQAAFFWTSIIIFHFGEIMTSVLDDSVHLMH